MASVAQQQAESSLAHASMPSRSGMAQLPFRHRLPSDDDPDAAARVLVVGNQRVMPAQLDRAGQLATVFVGASDRVSCLFVDGKHDGIIRF